MQPDSQQYALDQRLSHFITDEDRINIWNSAKNLLQMGEDGLETVMGLGYVQSGKTTSISALSALASDSGYRLVVAILGSTVLLKDQNRTRVEEYLGVSDGNYVWKSFHDFNESRTPGEIEDYLSRGRTVFLPVIKNVTVINKVSGILNRLNMAGTKVLVIDDEADQASLNTLATRDKESSTYAAIRSLRASVGHHLYVQYTATPYAPLLLAEGDTLMPERVEFLKPGQGYTGGREFFIDHKDVVVQLIPEADEQTKNTNLSVLPRSLEGALCNFFVGAAHLYALDKENAPISMLIHSTFKNDIQEKYEFLVMQYRDVLRREVDIRNSILGVQLQNERSRLYELGIPQLSDDEFWVQISFVLKEVNIWLVNSASQIKAINWNDAPFHILIGGNKLDRGFTVEGLTVTYMNRPASTQIDTLEQRARAFGYRTNLIPYCQFYATARTIRSLRGIVHTEEDLRISLRDYQEQGKSISEWANFVGLLLPDGTVASRKNVIPGLNYFSPDGEWQSIRKPSLEETHRASNLSLLQNTGLFTATPLAFGRLSFRSLNLPIVDVTSLLQNWEFDKETPGWRHDAIVDFLKRFPDKEHEVRVVLLEQPQEPGTPRVRSWISEAGFINLFQGEDTDFKSNPSAYPGDRNIKAESWDDEDLILEIHHVTRRGEADQNLYTLAIKLQGHAIVRRVGE